MNKTTIRLIIAVLVILLFIPSLVAQDKEKDSKPYWYFSYYKVNNAKIDSLYKLETKYGIPVAEEAKKQGIILEHKTLRHHTGDEYNIVFMTKLPSWSALEKNWFRTAFKVVEPDKDIRKKVIDSYNWVFEGWIHYDNIYTEITK